MKIFLLVYSAVLFLSGATPITIPGVRDESPIPNPQSPKMWTDNATVFGGESFTLHFSMPHEAYLGVMDPLGHFFYVAYPAENGGGKLRPFQSSEVFVTHNSLTINTLTLKCDPYTYGVLENQIVFTVPGTYRFILGENLHVDSEDGLSILKIEYTQKARPLFTSL